MQLTLDYTILINYNNTGRFSLQTNHLYTSKYAANSRLMHYLDHTGCFSLQTSHLYTSKCAANSDYTTLINYNNTGRFSLQTNHLYTSKYAANSIIDYMVLISR